METLFTEQQDSHWLHFVITTKSSFNRITLDQLGADPKLIDCNGANIFTIHETSGSSRHAHWIHWCPSWTKKRGCNCVFIRRSRQFGFTTKCYYIGKFTPEHWKNLIAYLSKHGKRTISVGQQGHSRLAQFQSACVNIKESQWNSSRNYFRCPFDDTEKPSDPPTTSGVNQNPRQIRTQKFSDVAETIYLYYNANKWISPEQAFQDPIFINRFQDMYYTYTESLKRINNLVFDQIQTEWKSLSFEEILLKRKNDLFNDCLYYDNDYSAHVLVRLLKCQFGSFEIIQEFLSNVLKVLNCQIPKINTINIKGPPGSGKTWFVETIGKLCWFTGRCDSSINKFTQFPFEHMLGKRVTIFNEFNLAPSFKDVVKEILEGANVTINVKYKNRCMLDRTPIFITTNNNWEMDHPEVDRKAFAQRMITYNWNSQPWLRLEDGYPHPPALARLFYKTPSELEDIYNQVPEKQFLNEHEQTKIFDKETYLLELNKDF